MSKALDFITYPEHEVQRKNVVLALHGRNANKKAFLPFVRQIAMPEITWMLPSAPYISPESHEVRWWYEHEEQNLHEIKRSRELITTLLGHILDSGVQSDCIFIMGFSQGAVMAIDTALRFPLPLGGLIVLSGYVTHTDLLKVERHLGNVHCPIFLAHGLRDQLLSIEHGRENHRILTMLGYAVEYHEYDTGHRISRQEAKDIQSFLERNMFKTAGS